MTVELIHEPSAGPRPFVLRCQRAGGVIQVGYVTREAAEAARPDFARMIREAYRS